MNDQTFTFRLDAELKAKLWGSAAAANVGPAEYLRDLLHRQLGEAQSALEAEVRRQSQLITKTAQRAGSDEAAVLGEIEAALDQSENLKGWID